MERQGPERRYGPSHEGEVGRPPGATSTDVPSSSAITLPDASDTSSCRSPANDAWPRNSSMFALSRLRLSRPTRQLWSFSFIPKGGNARVDPVQLRHVRIPALLEQAKVDCRVGRLLEAVLRWWVSECVCERERDMRLDERCENKQRNGGLNRRQKQNVSRSLYGKAGRGLTYAGP